MSSRNYGRTPNRSNNTDRKKHKNLCKTCGSHDSACNCKSKAPSKKVKPLTGDCALVNSVVCLKKVQKVAEAEIPLAFSLH